MSNKIFDIKERTFQFSKQIIFLIQEIDYARIIKNKSSDL